MSVIEGGPTLHASEILMLVDIHPALLDALIKVTLVLAFGWR